MGRIRNLNSETSRLDRKYVVSLRKILERTNFIRR